MAGSRREVEDRSDSGSPAPSSQTRRSGRRARKRKRGEDEFGGGEDEEDEDEAEADQSAGENESSASSDEDEDVEIWQGEEDDEVERPTKALCIHCDRDEYNDPSLDYEAPLECEMCNAFSHKQCANQANKDDGGVKTALDEESGKWRCPTCISSGHDSNLIPESTPSHKSRSRRVSAGKEDNSRTLRKRRAGDIDEEDDGPVSARRRKRMKQDKVRANGHVSDNQNGDYNLYEFEHIDGNHESNETLSLNTPGASSRKIHKQPTTTDSYQGEQRAAKVTYKKTPRKFNLWITNITSEKLEKILESQPKPSTVPPRPRKIVANSTRSARARSTAATDTTPATSTRGARVSPYYLPLNDDDKSKPYGGILSEAEAETTKTHPGADDRARFDRAREEADDERNTRLKLSSSALSHGLNGTGRGEKDKASEKKGGASKIECIHFGEFEIDTWYAAPYPEEYSRNRVLWICEFCLKYMNSEYVGWRHKMKCGAKHPPGDEVYRDGSISVFEIDGRKNPVYCQNLCLLAKLFLGSKTLYYDVEPFLFYVMTEFNECGMHFVGYFSKEKRSTSQNNVSCILTLPIHQRKGYGNLLIAFSYLLTRAEKKTGSPEKPFSDLGLVSYRNYWKLALCYELRDQKEPLTILDISRRTGMTPDDIICGLEALHALVRDPVTGTYALRLDYKAFQAHIDKWEAKGYVKLNVHALVWTPFIMGRSQALQFNDAPLSTIAPRAGEELSAIDEKAETVEMGDDDGKDNLGINHNRNGAATAANGEVMDLDALQSASHAQEEQEQDRISKSETEHTTVLHDLPPIPKPVTPNIKFGYEPNLFSNKWSGPRSPAKSPMLDNSGFMIPPTRFEIVPSVPGLTLKKGRAASSTTVRGRKRTSMSPATPRGRAVDTPKLRRGRTKLADTVTLNGANSPTREQIREFRDSPAASAAAAQNESHGGKSPSVVNKVMRPTNMDVASEV